MSFCSRIFNSIPMQYVYAGVATAASAVSYIVANISVSTLTSKAKDFGKECSSDFLNGPYSSAFCEALAKQANIPWVPAIGFYFTAGMAATGAGYAIWRARHYRQLSGPEGKALVVHEPEQYKCLLLAHRPKTIVWLTFGIFTVGVFTHLPLTFKMTDAATDLGRCITWNNVTSHFCKGIEAFNFRVSTANSVTVSVIGGLWAGAWAFAAYRRSSPTADSIQEDL